MQSTNFETQVLEAFKRAALDMGLSPQEVAIDSSFSEDFNLDSLQMLEMVELIERYLEVELPLEDMFGLRTIGEVALLISEKVNGDAATADAR